MTGKYKRVFERYDEQYTSFVVLHLDVAAEAQLAARNFSRHKLARFAKGVGVSGVGISEVYTFVIRQYAIGLM